MCISLKSKKSIFLIIFSVLFVNSFFSNSYEDALEKMRGRDTIDDYYQVAQEGDFEALNLLLWSETDFFGNKEISLELEEKCKYICKTLYENPAQRADIILNRIVYKHPFTLKAFEKKWFDINYVYEDGRTLLSTEIRIFRTDGDSDKIYLYLMENGADPNIKDKYGENILDIETQQYSVNWKKVFNIVKYMNTLNDSSANILIASLEDKNDVWKIVLEKIDDINKKSAREKSPLFVACQFGNFEAAKAFIEKGADVNALNNKLQTPLMAACSGGYYEIAELLIKNKADVNKFDSYGHSALFYCVTRPQLMTLLLDFGAKVNAKNKSGKNVVMDCAELYSSNFIMLDSLKVLEKYKADFKSTDKDKDTVLHYLMRSNAQFYKNDGNSEKMLEIIDFLLSKGVNINAKNSAGRTIAYYCEDEDLKKELEKRGCKF